MQSGFSSPYAVHKTDYFFKTPDNSHSNRRALSSEHHTYKTSTPISNIDYLRFSLSPEPKQKSSLNYYSPSPVYEHKVVLPAVQTLAEAQTKILLLSTEIESIKDTNYKLVKENEVLRARYHSSERIIDLENKLAILLAENEKLIFVVEELHLVYTVEKTLKSSSEVRKGSYSVERPHTSYGDVQSRLAALQRENEDLKNQVQKKEADFEGLMEKVAAIKGGVKELDLKRYATEKGTEYVEFDAGNERRMTEEHEVPRQSAITRGGHSERFNDIAEESRRKGSDNLYAGYNQSPSRSPLSNRSVRRDIEELLVDTEKLNNLVADKDKHGKNLMKQLEALLTKNNELQALVRDKNITIDLIKKEKERLGILVKEKMNEIEALKKTNSSRTSYYGNDILMSGSVRGYDEVRELKMKLEETKADYDRIKGKVLDADRAQRENERLNTVLGKIKTENEVLIKKMSELEAKGKKGSSNEADSLHNLLGEKEKDVMLIKHGLEMMDKELASLYVIRDEVNAKMRGYRTPDLENRRQNLFTDEKSLRGGYNSAVRSYFESPLDHTRRETNTNTNTFIETQRDLIFRDGKIVNLNDSQEYAKRANLPMNLNLYATPIKSGAFKEFPSPDPATEEALRLKQENERLNTVILGNIAEIDKLRKEINGGSTHRSLAATRVGSEEVVERKLKFGKNNDSVRLSDLIEREGDVVSPSAAVEKSKFLNSIRETNKRNAQTTPYSVGASPLKGLIEEGLISPSADQRPEFQHLQVAQNMSSLLGPSPISTAQLRPTALVDSIIEIKDSQTYVKEFENLVQQAREDLKTPTNREEKLAKWMKVFEDENQVLLNCLEHKDQEIKILQNKFNQITPNSFTSADNFKFGPIKLSNIKAEGTTYLNKPEAHFGGAVGSLGLDSHGELVIAKAELQESKQENLKLSSVLGEKSAMIEKLQKEAIQQPVITEAAKKELNILHDENQELKNVLNKKEKEIQRLSTKMIEVLSGAEPTSLTDKDISPETTANIKNNVNILLKKDEQKGSLKKSLEIAMNSKKSLRSSGVSEGSPTNKNRMTPKNRPQGGLATPKASEAKGTKTATKGQSLKFSDAQISGRTSPVEGQETSNMDALQLRQENKKLLQIIQAKGAEIETMKKDIEMVTKNTGTTKVEEAQKKIVELVGENKKLVESVKQKETSLKVLNENLTQLTLLTDEIQGVESITTPKSKVGGSPQSPQSRNLKSSGVRSPTSSNSSSKGISSNLPNESAGPEAQIAALRKVLEAKNNTKQNVEVLQKESVDNQKKITTLESEVKNLNHLIDAKEKEIQRLNVKLIEESVRANTNSEKQEGEIKTEIQRLKQENKQLTQTVEAKSTELGVLKSNIEVITQSTGVTKVEDAKEKIVELVFENKKLTEVLQQKEKALKTLNNNLFQLGQISEEVYGVNLESLVQSANTSNNTSNGASPTGAIRSPRANNATAVEGGEKEAEVRIAAIKKVIQEKGANLEVENQKKVTQLQGEVGNLSTMIEAKEKEIKRLNIKLIEESVRTHEEVSKQEDTQKQKVQELETKITSLVQENQNLNKAVEDKEKALKTLNNNLIQLSQLSEEIHGIDSSVATELSTSALSKQILQQQGTPENTNSSTIIKGGETAENQAEVQIAVLKRVLEAKGMTKQSLEVLQKGKEDSEKKIERLEDEVENLTTLVEAKEKEIKRLNVKLIEESAANSHQVAEIQQEIQKLKQENDKLADEIEDKQTEIMILKKSGTTKDKSIENLKKSIQESEFTDKQKLAVLEDENQRLVKLVQSKEKQLGEVKVLQEGLDLLKVSQDLNDIKAGVIQRGEEKARLHQSLHEKDLEIEALKNVIEEKDRTIENVQHFEGGVEELEKMIELLVGENERLKGLLNEKMAEVKKKSPKHAKKLSQVSEQSGEQIVSRADGDHFENLDIAVFEGLKKENERLLRDLEEKDREIEELKDEIGGYEELKEELATKKKMVEEIQQLMNSFVEEKELIEHQIITLEAKNEDLEKENHGLREDVENVRQEEREQLEEKIKEETVSLRKLLDKEKADSEERITRLNTEIGRVQAHLNRTLMDLQDERKRFSELEVLRAQEIDSIRQQYEAYEREEAATIGIPEQLEAERRIYEMEIDSLNTANIELERDLELLREENKELRRVGAVRVKEIDDIRKQMKAMEDKYKVELSEIRKTVGNIQVNKQDDSAIKYRAEKAIDQAQISTLQKMNSSLTNEVEKIKATLEEKKNSHLELTQQYNALRHMHQSLKKDLEERTNEGEKKNERIKTLEREITDLEDGKK